MSGLLVVDESGIVSACNHHFTMLTFGKAHGEVVSKPISSIITAFCHESHLIQPPLPRSRNISLSPVNNNHSGNGNIHYVPYYTCQEQDSLINFLFFLDSDSDANEEEGSRKSPLSQSVQHSQVSQVTRDKSSSAMCVDKSSCQSCQNLDKTHTPTPTQDMVSSISTCDQRLDADLSLIPDVISALSNMSMDEDYHNSSISKSRSENILGSENRENNLNLANKHNDTTKSTDRSDSVYFTSRKSTDLSMNGCQRAKCADATAKLNFDTSKSSTKMCSVKSVVSLLDRSTMSLDLCDSNETSADFLTPINEMPLSSGEGFTDDTDLLSEKSVAFKPDKLKSAEIISDNPLERKYLLCTYKILKMLISFSFHLYVVN